MVGVTRQQVQHWEYGDQGTTTRRFQMICTAFGVTPEQFWDDGYIPGDLFGDNEKAPTTSVIDAGVPKVDDNSRAFVCPRCKNDEHSETATYCAKCAFPLYNLCSGDDRHRNVPAARFCETCGAKTFWGMDSGELEEHGVPPVE